MKRVFRTKRVFAQYLDCACAACGKTLKRYISKSAPRRKYYVCDRNCQRIVMNGGRGQTSCAVCGKGFYRRRTSNDSRTCCSRECGWKYLSLIAKQRKAPAFVAIEFRDCRECGKLFCVKAGLKRLLCSKKCSLWGQYRRQLALERANRVAPTPKPCKECGRSFTPTTLREQLYCSPRCSASQEHRKRRIKLTIGARCEDPPGLWEIWDKSNGRCHICNMLCRKDVRGGGLSLGWTVDHIVPLSRGGLDRIENVRVAHLVCNSIKNDHLLSDDIRALASSRVVEEFMKLIESRGDAKVQAPSVS